MKRSVGSSRFPCRSTDTNSKVARRWNIIKWTELLQIQRGSVKRIQQEIENAIKELGTIGQIAQCTVSQAQRVQEDTADLYSKILQASEESRKTKIAIGAASTMTHTRRNQLDQEIKRCDEEIVSSEQHRDGCKHREDYYDEKSDKYHAVSS